MLIIIAVNIYMSRIVLKALGIDDYGIYNVIGGAIAMFSILTSSLSTAISRYITYTLGKKDLYKLKEVFSTSLIIQIVLAVFIVLFAEIIGNWLLFNYLNIPIERTNAAVWVLHCSIIIFAIRLVGVPYDASIIAHERMSAFAYISITEALLTLFVAILLKFSSGDKLILYAILLVVVTILARLLYTIYCYNKFNECKFSLAFDKGLLKEIAGFAGWNFMGVSANVFNTQGINVITNIFFGVRLNAARGITDQVQSLVMQFVRNFTMAFNPQITKSYAENDNDYLFSLIFKGAKFSYYLMLIFIVPFMFEIETVLSIWLGDYPSYAPLFIRLSLIANMIDFLGNQVAMTVWATGDVRKYYLITTPVSFLVFPVSLLLFYLGYPAEVSYWVFIIDYMILIPLRLYVLNGLIPEFKPEMFFKNVILVILPTTLCAFIIPTILFFVLPQTFLSSILVMIVGVLCTVGSIYIIGMNNNERLFAIGLLLKFIHKNKGGNYNEI